MSQQRIFQENVLTPDPFFGALRTNWRWMLAFGILSVILGVLIIAGWPGSTLWVIGLFIAVELIVSGWSQIVLALAARRGSKAPQEAERVSL